MMKDASISMVILLYIEHYSHLSWQVREGLGQVPETRPLPNYPVCLLIISSFAWRCLFLPLATEIFHFCCELSMQFSFSKSEIKVVPPAPSNRPITL